MCAGALGACAVQKGADWVSGGAPDSELDARGAAVSRAFPAPLTQDTRDENPGRASAQGRALDLDESFSDEPAVEPVEDGAPVLIREYGTGAAPARKSIQSKDSAASAGPYRNTYYDFPAEGAGLRQSALYDAACHTIAYVTKEFHDRVCLQGSGKLSSGETVSFAKRDCACAAECPRSGQHICYERLDSTLFPHGRGATGRAITPLRTVAVDSSVIPLGTVIYIPEFDGIDRPDGAKHDGCFVAEDRGIRVVGRHVDVFAGDPASALWMNKKVPSNRGVNVVANDPRCMTRFSAGARGPAP